MYPCQCGAQMEVRLFTVNTCNGICGGEEKKKFPLANFSDCWSSRSRGKNRVSCISEESVLWEHTIFVCLFLFFTFSYFNVKQFLFVHCLIYF